MLLSINDIRVRHVRIRNTPTDPFVQVKRVNCEGVLVYTASQTVTYRVDTNLSYQEEVEYGSSCLAPTTFTPKKSGWTFLGWREDTSASSSTLSTKTMGESPITLYAVFKQTVTCTFTSYNSNQTSSGTKYYNNGDVLGADVKVPSGASYSGWSWRGWGLVDTSGGDSDVVYSNGATITGMVSGQTYYGLYQRTITLSYNGNGANSGSVGSQTGTRYWNACGSYTNPSFVLAGNGYGKTNCTFSRWAMGSTGGSQYSVGSRVSLTDNTVFYAVWSVNVIDNRLVASGTGGGQSDGGYYINTANYSEITYTMWAKSVWAYYGIGIGSDYNNCYKVTGTATSEKWTPIYLNITPNQGVVYISFGISPDGEYGGSLDNTEWEVRLTAR